MTNRQKLQYYCFECRFAKSAYGSLICKVYRGAILVSSKACLDFELKKDFKRRADKRKKNKAML
ncbi:hypothetical protein [Brachyspira innocens]|uniref:hypothetical protein n=1 Tax=Brachyspira innocens TaxID=13264 RepID=UPI0026ECB3E8|nr:hypothetical protein [Brachyspira innocens]